MSYQKVHIAHEHTQEVCKDFEKVLETIRNGLSIREKIEASNKEIRGDVAVEAYCETMKSMGKVFGELSDLVEVTKTYFLNVENTICQTDSVLAAGGRNEL